MKVMFLFALVVLAVAQMAYAAPEGSVEQPSSVSLAALKVPTLVRACTNSACNSLCVLLGYGWGQCADAEWCYCYL